LGWTALLRLLLVAFRRFHLKHVNTCPDHLFLDCSPFLLAGILRFSDFRGRPTRFPFVPASGLFFEPFGRPTGRFTGFSSAFSMDLMCVPLVGEFS
jgi:hypothetical protein